MNGVTIPTWLLCSDCGVEAPTRIMRFDYSIGMLVASRQVEFKGIICKRCMHRIYWSFTATNLFCGWWGFFSGWITCYFLARNLATYARNSLMAGVPRGAKVPELTESHLKRLEPACDQIVDICESAGDADRAALESASVFELTPGQFVTYVDWLKSTGRYYQKFAANPEQDQKAWW